MLGLSPSHVLLLQTVPFWITMYICHFARVQVSNFWLENGMKPGRETTESCKNCNEKNKVWEPLLGQVPQVLAAASVPQRLTRVTPWLWLCAAPACTWDPWAGGLHVVFFSSFVVLPTWNSWSEHASLRSFCFFPGLRGMPGWLWDFFPRSLPTVVGVGRWAFTFRASWADLANTLGSNCLSHQCLFVLYDAKWC